MSALRLSPIPALRDNYIWLLADDFGNALVVDPGDDAPVLEALARENLKLRAILLTHHHPDHVAGAAALRAATQAEVIAPFDTRIEQATRRVADAEAITISAPECIFYVLAVPGHTSSHVAYHGHGLLFSGDTLFSIGCGRLFEGTPAQMLDSLERLAALPADTQVCCGHEYTVANCAFARTLDPGNAELAKRATQAQDRRANGQSTLPSLLADERACNPFLRIDDPAIRHALGGEVEPGADRVAYFAALRRIKDSFRA